MAYDSFIHHRRSIRLTDYDYSSEGAYFITICSHQREILFDSDPVQEIILRTWNNLRVRFLDMRLDEFIIMPNHIHGIIWIDQSVVGAGSPRPHIQPQPTQPQSLNLNYSQPTQGEQPQGAVTAPLQIASKRTTLGQIIAYFKYCSAKEINLLTGTPGNPIWQRNYHERIIRNDQELENIRQYIIDNPRNWNQDPENQNLTLT